MRIHASSGTGGKPTVVAYPRADLAVWRDVMARALAAAGARPGHMIQIAYGYGLSPSQLAAALLTLPDLGPHYQLVVDRTRSFPTLAVHVEPAERLVGAWGGFDAAAAQVRSLSARVSQCLRAYLGLNPEIATVPPRTIPRSEGKAVRVVERR